MAKGRPRTFDKDDALDTALKLFWHHGYDGTSIAQLAEAMGIKIPSLYAAFGSKEELFIASVERYGALNGCLYHDALTQPTAKKMVEHILMGEVELVTRKSCPDGCLMIQGALTTAPESENIRQMMNRMRNTPITWMKDRFIQAQKDGDLPEDADPDALAHYIMTLNSGLAIMARSGASRKKLEKIVALALDHWPE